VDGVQINGDVEPVRESIIRRRRKWSAREKAQIVQEAQRAGAVLQEVAQRHGLHPGLLTRWRAQHQAEARKKATRREARLLPVRVEPRARPHARVAQSGRLSESSAKLGTIEVEFSAGCRLHVQGSVDAQTLRAVLQELSRL
jgi:transposase